MKLDSPVSQQVIANLLDISRQGVGQVESKGICRRDMTLGEWIRAYCNHLRAIAAGRSSSDEDLDLGSERAALARVQRERIELELAETRGELVRVDDVLNAWAGHIGTAKTAFLGLPARIAGQIAGPGKRAEIEAVLRTAIKATLTELSNDGLPRKRGKPAGRGVADVGSATGSDGQSVV